MQPSGKNNKKNELHLLITMIVENKTAAPRRMFKAKIREMNQSEITPDLILDLVHMAISSCTNESKNNQELGLAIIAAINTLECGLNAIKN